MGEIGAEPSMEEILSSIKRIIAEEGDGQPRPRRPARAATTVDRRSGPVRSVRDDGGDADPGGRDDAGAEPTTDGGGADPVLELSDPIPDPGAPRGGERADAGKPESILSQETAAASRGSLDTLSRLVVKQEPGSDGTLEGLVREMLRPMLREWLDANLPDLVETMVAREIAKITGQAR